MEDSVKENSTNSVSGSAVKSKLRYPLRSALKSKEEEASVPEFTNSSASRRGRAASTVSQSTNALTLSATSNKSAKPPRRLSVPVKSTVDSASKSTGSITPISETGAKSSSTGRGKSDTPVSGVSRLSSSRRKVDDLSSASYWLSQIKLSETASKHSISLGFFKLAKEACCEPLQRMRDELKSYIGRNNLGEVTDTVKELFEIYNIPENSEQSVQVPETCSHMPEEGTQSLDGDGKSSASMSADSNVTPTAFNNDAARVSTSKKETVWKIAPQTRTRRSLNPTAKTLSDSQVPDEGTQSSVSTPADMKVTPKAINKDTAKASTVTRTAKKETVSKNSSPAKTRRSLNNSSANSRTVPETRGQKPQKKAEKNTKSETNQEKHDMKQGKKSAVKGPASPSLESKTVEENKENLDAPPVEEIGLAEA